MEKPGRYCGGEYGRLAKKDASLQTLIAFPDLYEIGMSNQALRIIYNGLNRIPGVSCDRAFAPAPDFERLLREKGLPLYGLDTGIGLKSLDLLLFTLGYELGFSGILAMLDVSGIPLRKNQRGESDPLIIAGGPAVSNPLPYSDFIDAFWIGEAEAGFFDLTQELLTIKQTGGNKPALLEHMQKHPHIWVKGKKAVRAIDMSFGNDLSLNAPLIPDQEGNLRPSGSAEVPRSPIPDPRRPAIYPIPSMKIVQHHGILEIMRGCPNGCRFCHAGYWYRPMRQRTQEALVREAEAFITLGGYREISLSSLSSGDYAGIGGLVDDLNRRFSGKHVSFQLPSLRVSTFSLSLLEKISTTRKSGLTFAVETPRDFWQMALNKQVTADSVVEILREAKRNGWRSAKFYFMIGLPLPDMQGGEGGGLLSGGEMLSKRELSEEEEIVNFVNTVARRTAMHFNVNVGIFVPKPHTPYQWARQIDGQTAAVKLDFIRSRLRSKGHKVSVSDTLVSTLEGILSRGDERAGELFEQAFRAGSRLDPWQEFIDRDVWADILARNGELAGEFLAAKTPDTPLPWQGIVSGVSGGYLHREWEKSVRGEMSPPCTEDCAVKCGVCNKGSGIREPQPSPKGEGSPPDQGTGSEVSKHSELPTRSGNEQQSPIPDPRPQQQAASRSGVDEQIQHVVGSLKSTVCDIQREGFSPSSRRPTPDPTIFRLLFSFTKESTAVFHGHLSLVEIFPMALNRAGLDVSYTQGFNPLAKLEIVSPLSTGIGAGSEIAAADFSHEFPPAEFIEKMNAALPEGIRINRAEIFRISAGSKKHSLSSLLWGFGYTMNGVVSLSGAAPDGETVYVPATGEKAYREQCLPAGGTVFSLRRVCVLAKNPLSAASSDQPPWASYFDRMRQLYPLS